MRDSFVDKEDDIMATRLSEQYKWTKDGRKWVFYCWISSLNGKRKKYTSPASKTKNEALKAEREYSLKMNVVKEDKNMTFKELYTKYYSYQENKVKPTTLKTYRDRIKYMQLLDNVKLKDLSVKHYELWRKEINKFDISTTYKNDIQKFINHNEIKKEMDFYTLEEFKRFISNEDNLKFKCLYETLYYCGLRRGEARALTWNDINFEDKELRVNKNIVQLEGENSHKYMVTTPKTKSSIRTIPIAETLLNDFKRLLEQDKKTYGFKKSWYVFGTDIPITNSQLRDRKNQLCQKANLKQIRIHDFRHSCASLLINNDANITMVAKYLGHTKINETLNTYSHMFKNKLNDIVNTINKLT